MKQMPQMITKNVMIQKTAVSVGEVVSGTAGNW
jgi:hypothetical protein